VHHGIEKKDTENAKAGIGHSPQKNQGCSPMKLIDELEMMFSETGELDEVRALAAKKIVTAANSPLKKKRSR